MSFCVKCGSQIPDDSNFCLSCGARVNNGQPQQAAPASEAPKGMRTVAEVEKFYRETMEFSERNIKKYMPGVQKIVATLLPNEAIEFAGYGVLGGVSDGVSSQFATTNLRLIVVETPSGIQSTGRALHGTFGSAVQSYQYTQLAGVNLRKNFLYSTVLIGLVNGSYIQYDIDKKWAEITYKGLNASLSAHKTW